MYVRNRGSDGKVYWKCRKYPQCTARVTTSSLGDTVNILKVSDHPTHGVNYEEVEAAKYAVLFCNFRITKIS